MLNVLAKLDALLRAQQATAIRRRRHRLAQLSRRRAVSRRREHAPDGVRRQLARGLGRRHLHAVPLKSDGVTCGLAAQGTIGWRAAILTH